MNTQEYETLNDNEDFELNDLNKIKPNISKSKNETGTVFSSIVTLSNTLLGSGMLAMVIQKKKKKKKKKKRNNIYIIYMLNYCYFHY